MTEDDHIRCAPAALQCPMPLRSGGSRPPASPVPPMGTRRYRPARIDALEQRAGPAGRGYSLLVPVAARAGMEMRGGMSLYSGSPASSMPSPQEHGSRPEGPTLPQARLDSDSIMGEPRRKGTRFRRRLSSTILALAVCLSGLADASAQDLRPSSVAGFDLPRDTLAVRRPVLALGAMASLDTPAIGDGVPFDLAVARRVRESTILRSRAAEIGLDGFGFLAVPGAALVAGGLYAVGELRDRPDLRDSGLRTAESLAVAAAATGLGKFLTGRARPYRSPENSSDFAIGRGIRSDAYRSLPSAHAAAAFATATSLTLDPALGRSGAHPWLAPTVYFSASLGGLSRVQGEKHWASDVVLGSVVGSLSAWVVARYRWD